ncbi:MAG: class II fructose-bisphosphate aldolase [Caldilineaceae bacterium]
MIRSTTLLLSHAQQHGYAIGAFNVYNLEGVRAVILAAEAESSPIMLQLHPASITHGGRPLLTLCLAAAEDAKVPVSVHLDHSASADDIRLALSLGITSIMADGSHLDYAANFNYVQSMATLVHQHSGFVEAELGRLSGTEDGLSVAEYESKLTDPDQAADFVREAQIDALAVCIGNVHGHYRGEPKLDFQRLAALRQKVTVPLVLHGASGLPAEMIQRSIELGVCKFNVNTEVREAYLASLKIDLNAPKAPDLVALMQHAIDAMRRVVVGKLRLFGSVGKA